MKFCRTCGTLYSGSLECCPKCNPKASEAPEHESETAPADRKTVRRQWLFLCIGIPAFIGLIWLIGAALAAAR